jgi:hypothetical protein
LCPSDRGGDELRHYIIQIANFKSQNPSSKQIPISKFKILNVLSIGILGFNIVPTLPRMLDEIGIQDLGFGA